MEHASQVLVSQGQSPTDDSYSTANGIHGHWAEGGWDTKQDASMERVTMTLRIDKLPFL